MILKELRIDSWVGDVTNCYIVQDEKSKETMVIDPAGDVDKIVEMLDILKEYDDYNDKGNIFAAKLLRLLVLDHFYVYGSKDYKSRQKIWEKMQF